MKQQHKRVPRPYFDNQDMYGRTTNRSSTAWHFLRRDMIIQKAKLLDQQVTSTNQYKQDSLSDSESSSSSGDEAEEVESDNEKSSLLRLEIENLEKLKHRAIQSRLPPTIRHKIPRADINEEDIGSSCNESGGLVIDVLSENSEEEEEMDDGDYDGDLRIKQEDYPEPSITCVNVSGVPNIVEKLKFDPGFSRDETFITRTVMTSSPIENEGVGVDGKHFNNSDLTAVDKLLTNVLASSDIPIEFSTSIKHPLDIDHKVSFPVPSVQRLNSSSDRSMSVTPEDMTEIIFDSQDSSCSDVLFHNGTLEQEVLSSQEYDFGNKSFDMKDIFINSDRQFSETDYNLLDEGTLAMDNFLSNVFSTESKLKIESNNVLSPNSDMSSCIVKDEVAQESDEETVREVVEDLVGNTNRSCELGVDEDYIGTPVSGPEVESKLLREIDSEIEIFKVSSSTSTLKCEHSTPSTSILLEDALEFDKLESFCKEASYQELCESEILDRETLKREGKILKKVVNAPTYKGLCRVVTVLNQRGSNFVDKSCYSQLFDTDGVCWKLSDLPTWIGFKSNKSRNAKSLLKFGLSRRSKKVMDSHLRQAESPVKTKKIYERKLSPPKNDRKTSLPAYDKRLSLPNHDRKVSPPTSDRKISPPPAQAAKYCEEDMAIVDTVDSTDDSSRTASPAPLTKPVKVTIDDSLPLIDLQRKLKAKAEKPQFVKFNIMKKRREERNEAFRAEMEREKAEMEKQQAVSSAYVYIYLIDFWLDLFQQAR